MSLIKDLMQMMNAVSVESLESPSDKLSPGDEVLGTLPADLQCL
jgi:hypothetical protein